MHPKATQFLKVTQSRNQKTDVLDRDFPIRTLGELVLSQVPPAPRAEPDERNEMHRRSRRHPQPAPARPQFRLRFVPKTHRHTDRHTQSTLEPEERKAKIGEELGWERHCSVELLRGRGNRVWGYSPRRSWSQEQLQRSCLRAQLPHSLGPARSVTKSPA